MKQFGRRNGTELLEQHLLFKEIHLVMDDGENDGSRAYSAVSKRHVSQYEPFVTKVNQVLASNAKTLAPSSSCHLQMVNTRNPLTPVGAYVDHITWVFVAGADHRLNLGLWDWQTISPYLDGPCLRTTH